MRQPHHRRFVILLYVLGLLLGGMIGSGHIRSYDVWWHQQLGQDIIRTGDIGLYDEYSHTAAGNFRPPQQWLFEVVQAATYRLGQDRALVWLRMILAAFALGLLAVLLVCRKSSYLLTVVVLVLVAAASMPNVTCRPHLMMPLLLLALVSLLEGSTSRPWLKWLVPLLFVLWANTHASFTLGLAIVGFWLVHRALGSRQRVSDGLRLSAPGVVEGASLLLACIAASVLNPVRFKLLLYSLNYLPGGAYSYHAQLLQEWQAPTLASLEMAATTVVLIGGALVVLVRMSRVSLFQLLLAGLMVMMGLRWGRAAMPAAIIMAWVLTPVLSEWLRELSPTLLGWSGDSKTAPERILPLAMVVIALVGVMSIYRPVTAKRALNENLFPVAAVEWIDTHDLRGNMYNPYHWGGYLIHRLYPRHKVFIDGRVDMYGREVFADWLTIRETREGWEEVAESYNVQWGIVQPGVPLAAAVQDKGNWAAVYRDPQATVFVNRNGPNSRLVEASRTKAAPAQGMK